MMEVDHNLNVTLVKIAENLREKDVNNLRFLCHDILPAGEIEKCNALNIIDTLSNYHVITSNNYKFLLKCLKKIHRIDLMKKLNSGSSKIDEFEPKELNPFRALLFDLALDLRSEDVKKLRFFYRNHIKENNVDALSIFTLLLEGDVINEKSYDSLVTNLSSISRNDLASKLKEFCHYPVEQRRWPISESCANKGQGTKLPSEEASGSKETSGSEETSGSKEPISRGCSKRISREYYKMESVPRGFCVIINNIEFTSGPEREGAHVDQNKLKDLFEKFQFTVKIYQNSSSEEMKACLKKYSDADQNQYDCFTCFILSHGAKGEVYGSDSIPVPIDELVELFNTDKCPSLQDKPKLFFIQACQNENDQKDCPFDAVDCSGYGDPVIKADVSIFMSTIPGYYSYRCPEEGCRFIKHLTNEFETYADEKDLLEMITNVIKLVSDEGKDKQLPTHNHQLRKSLRFISSDSLTSHQQYD